MQLTTEGNWLAGEITDGLQRLSTLCLARSPQPDVLPLTNKVWLAAIEPHTLWDRGRDAPRIRSAFQVLLSTRTTWPSPRDLLDALPPRPKPPALPPPPPSTNPEHIQKLRLMRARISMFCRTNVRSA